MLINTVMSLMRAMATVGGLTGLSRLAGFARDILTAAVLGAGPVADAFFVALKLPNFFRRVTAEGAFSVSFVPLYSEALEKEGKQGADDFAGNAMSIMFWILLLFTVVIMVAMPVVILLIAPGFGHDPQRYDLAVTLCRITFPYLLMISMAALLGGVLNAHGRFAPFAAAPILFNLSLIALMLFAWKFKTPAHALAWGVITAGVVQFVMLFFFIRREGIRLMLHRPRVDERIKRLFKLMGPGVLGAGIMQINLFADMIIGSLLPTGAISYLYYADRLNQLPLGMIGIAVGTALLPMLARSIAAGKEQEARDLFNRAMEGCMLLALPAATALLLISYPIVRGLFEHGAFDHHAAVMTSIVVTIYACGIPPYVASKVYSTAFWSRQDTVTPVKASIVSAISNIVMGLTFIFGLHSGVAGIALATAIAGWIQIAFLIHGLKGREEIRFDDRFKKNLLKIAISCLFMGIYLVVAEEALSSLHAGGGNSIVANVIVLGGLIGGGLVVYGLGIVGTGIVRPRDIKSYFAKK